MDLSQWSNIGNSIKILPTTKKFYQHYLYKLSYTNIKGGYLITFTRKDRLGKFPTAGSQALTEADFGKLYTISELYHNRDLGLKWRFEGSTVSVFADNEELLYNVAVNELAFIKNHLVSITRPQSDHDRSILESGKIIMRTDTDYRFKVTLRSGFRYQQDRNNLGNYLNSIRSEIKITDFLLQGLISNYKYLHNYYFYVNDPKIVDMIVLIAPTAVRRVEEVVIN